MWRRRESQRGPKRREVKSISCPSKRASTGSTGGRPFLGGELRIFSLSIASIEARCFRCAISTRDLIFNTASVQDRDLLKQDASTGFESVFETLAGR